jgi:hypothetical protein
MPVQQRQKGDGEAEVEESPQRRRLQQHQGRTEIGNPAAQQPGQRSEHRTDRGLGRKEPRDDPIESDQIQRREQRPQRGPEADPAEQQQVTAHRQVQREPKAPADHLGAELRNGEDRASQQRQEQDRLVEQTPQLEGPVPDHLRVLDLELVAQTQEEKAQDEKVQHHESEPGPAQLEPFLQDDGPDQPVTHQYFPVRPMKASSSVIARSAPRRTCGQRRARCPASVSQSAKL